MRFHILAFVLLAVVGCGDIKADCRDLAVGTDRAEVEDRLGDAVSCTPVEQGDGLNCVYGESDCDGQCFVRYDGSSRISDAYFAQKECGSGLAP
jgi:hypothetical protein